MSETYTAIYERVGDAWAVQIAEAPHISSRCPSVPEARERIREALAQWLGMNSAELRVVDNFRMPARIRTAQESVKATRTDNDRSRMMASMTDSRSATQWAEDLGMSMRDPVTVQALMNLEGRQISIDTFCHTITMAEELTRLTATADQVPTDTVFENN